MGNIQTYTLKCGDIEMLVTNFGARVMKLFAPDRDGQLEDVVLGYNTIDEYLNNKGERYLGAVCGRYANRIAKGRFTLDGVEYQLPINNNGQTLHGGILGLDCVVWDVEEASESTILFKYVSVDGEDGFPGTLTIYMRYDLTEENEFVISYRATSDKRTPVNITHHSFFNLRGEGNGTVNDHMLQLYATKFLPINEYYIPTGEIRSVEGTPFDFRKLKRIGESVYCDDEQLQMGSGYDHCFVIDGEGFRPVATVIEPESGRRMDVLSDQAGVQFYGGNFFDGETISKGGDKTYLHRGSFALETQLFPDGMNQEGFPNTILEVGEEYIHNCIYRFSVEK